MTPNDIERFFDDLMYKIQNRNLVLNLGELANKVEEKFKQYRSPSKNILIVHCDKIGDQVLTSGFIREIRKNFPTADITLISNPMSYPLIEHCPYVNETTFFDDEGRYNMESFTGVLYSIIEYCKKSKLWYKNFNLAFSPKCGQNNFITLLLMWLTGAKERVGFVVNPYGVQQPTYTPTGIRSSDEVYWSNFLLTRPITINDKLLHHEDKMFHILKSVGLKVTNTDLELFLTKEDILVTKDILKNIPSDKKIVALGISASENNKIYPIEKLLIVLRELIKDNLFFVILGDYSSKDSARYLTDNLPKDKLLNLTGKTNVREVSAIISQCDYYLGSDTGLTHMAAAAKLPCLVISREAKSTEKKLPRGFCENTSYAPWHTKYKIICLDHQLDECETMLPVHGGCHHKNEAHCIAAIDPKDIIEGFRELIQ